MYDFNFYLMPVCGFHIDKRYNLFQSHFISNIEAYDSEKNVLNLTRSEQYVLSEIVNIVFIQENYYIEENFYKRLSETETDFSVFNDVKNAVSAQQLLSRIETKYDHFLFYSRKSEILLFKEKLKDLISQEIEDISSDDESKSNTSNEIRPKRIDHIEYLIITNELQKDRVKTIESCYADFSKEKYKLHKNQFENILLKFNQPMSNILPPYYSDDYAKSLLSNDAFSQWLEEKTKSTYVIKQQEIINIEANRLVPNMTVSMFNKTILFTKYKQQIWTKYQQIWKN
jgi:hypothetical protein